MFNFTEETFKQVEFFLDKLVTVTRYKPIISRWNNRFHLSVLDGLDKRITVVTFIAQ